MPEIKSPLRYPGGKNLFTKIICPLLGDFDEYREPFLGGGSIFLYLKNRFPDKDFVVSDKFKNLYLFWKFAKEENDRLVSEIRKLKSEFTDGKELWKLVTSRSKFCSDFQKAVDFFVINRISFSGVSYCGGFSQGSFDGRFTDSSIDRVSLLSSILSGVDILNYDYSELLRMKPKKEGSKVVIYCDPPYFISNPKLYGKKGDIHSSFSHKRFAQMMRGCKHKWLISYNDCEEIRKMFEFANITDYTMYYPMRHEDGDNKIGGELLISNFELNMKQNPDHSDSEISTNKENEK